MRYGEIIRKFYHLPRAAFPELRIARAAISRSVRALVRRHLVVIVRQYVRPGASIWNRGAGGVSANLTAAGLAVARVIPASYALPRATRRPTTKDDISSILSLRTYTFGKKPDPGSLKGASAKQIEQIKKAAARLRARPDRSRARQKKPLIYKGYSRRSALTHRL